MTPLSFQIVGAIGSLCILPILYFAYVGSISKVKGASILALSFFASFCFFESQQTDVVVATFSATVRFFGYGVGAAIVAAALEPKLLPDRYVSSTYKNHASRLRRDTRMWVFCFWMVLVAVGVASAVSFLHLPHWLEEALGDTAIGLGAGLFIAEKLNGSKIK